MMYLTIPAVLVLGWLLFRAIRKARDDRKVYTAPAKLLAKRVMCVEGNPSRPRKEGDVRIRTELYLVAVRLGNDTHEITVDEHTFKRFDEGESALLIYRFPKKGKVEPLEVIPTLDS